MKSNWARGWILGCLVACLAATTASCSDDDTPPPPPTDLQRGTMAATREDACGVESWKPLDVGESLGILLSVFPGGHKRGVDCILAAKTCQEADACMLLFIADNDKYEAELQQLPKCGSERTDHCEGNVAKPCVQDGSGPFYEASYDCTLAGATCIVTEAAGEPYANCQAPPLQCKGPHQSYCDGTRAVVCETISDGVLSPWVYDCADAWGSHCIDHGNGNIECEGPVVGEKDCNDGIDGDGDGKIDCEDDDCHCNSAASSAGGASGASGTADEAGSAGTAGSAGSAD
jgi:hypothetical protein